MGLAQQLRGRSKPTVMAGDFNNNVIWDKGRRRDWQTEVDRYAGRGLVSAYRKYFGEEQGSESRPMHWWRMNTAMSYHLDFCFVPEAWTITQVWVGGPEDWLRAGDGSDHAPLVVDRGAGMSRSARPRIKTTTWDWAAGTPLVYQALASGDPLAPMPAASEQGDDLMVAASYWTALLQLLVFSFGWADPARGLARIRSLGYFDDDPRQRLIKEIWERDGQLDFFHAWLAGWDGNSEGRSLLTKSAAVAGPDSGTQETVRRAGT